MQNFSSLASKLMEEFTLTDRLPMRLTTKGSAFFNVQKMHIYLIIIDTQERLSRPPFLPVFSYYTIF